MQDIGNQISELMKKFTEVLRVEECSVCEKEFRVIAHLDNDGNRRSISEDCPYCRKEKEEKEMQEEIRESMKRSKMNKYNWLSELPFDLEGATFNNYHPQNKTQQELLEVSKQYANAELDKTTLFFQGETGLGKTHLSYCIYQSFRLQVMSCIFIDLPSLLSTIRNSYNDINSPSQEKILQAIAECELFVLDDIGAEYVKPDASGFESWAADILFQIANSRQGKRNVYTTNFTSKYLNQKYGMMSKRIISRLMSNAKVIKVEGRDYRLRGLE